MASLQITEEQQKSIALKKVETTANKYVETKSQRAYADYEKALKSAEKIIRPGDQADYKKLTELQHRAETVKDLNWVLNPKNLDPSGSYGKIVEKKKIDSYMTALDAAWKKLTPEQQEKFNVIVNLAEATTEKEVKKKAAVAAEKEKSVLIGKMSKTVSEQLRSMSEQQYNDVAVFFKLHYNKVEGFKQAKTGDAPQFMKALTEYDKVIRNSMLTNLFEKKEVKERMSTDKELSSTLAELIADSKVLNTMKQLGFASGKVDGSSHSSWGAKEKETGAAYLNAVYNHSDGSVWAVRYQYQQTGEEKMIRGEAGVSNITKYDEKGKKLWEVKEADLRVRSDTTLSNASNGELNKETLTIIEQLSFNISETALRRSGKTIDGYFGLYNYDGRDKLFGWTRKNPAGDALVRFYGNVNYAELLGRLNNKYRYIQGTPEWVAQWITGNSAMLSAAPMSFTLQPTPQLTNIPGTIGGFAPLNSMDFGRYDVYIKGEKVSATKLYDRTPIEIGEFGFNVVLEESIGGRSFAYVTLSDKEGKEVTDQFTIRAASNEIIKPVEISINKRNTRTNTLETAKATVLKTEIGELLKLERKGEEYSLRITYAGTPTQEVAESEVVYLFQLNVGGSAKSLYLRQGQELRMSAGAREYLVRLESAKVSELGGALGKIRDLTVSVSDVTSPTETKKREVSIQVGGMVPRTGGVAIPEFGMSVNAEMAPEYMQKIPMSTLTLASGLAVVNSTKMNENQWLTRSFSQLSGRSMAVMGETVQFGTGQGQGDVVAAAGFLDLKEKGMQVYALGQDPKTLLESGIAQIGSKKYEMGLIRSVPRERMFDFMGGRIGEEERQRTEGILQKREVTTDYTAKQVAAMSYDSILNEAVSSIGGGPITGSLSGSNIFAMRQALPDSKTFHGLVLETLSYQQEKLGGAERDEQYERDRVVVRHQLGVGGVKLKTRYTFEWRKEETFQGKLTPQNVRNITNNEANTIDQSLGLNSKLSLFSRYSWGGSESESVTSASRSKQTVGNFITDQKLHVLDILGLSGLNVTIGLNYQTIKSNQEEIATDLIRTKTIDNAYGLTIGPEWIFKSERANGRLYAIFQQNISKTSTENYVRDALTSAQTIETTKKGYEAGGQADWKNGFGVYGRIRIDEIGGTGIGSQQINALLAPTYTVSDVCQAQGNINLTRYKSGGAGYQDIAYGAMLKVWLGKGGKKAKK